MKRIERAVGMLRHECQRLRTTAKQGALQCYQDFSCFSSGGIVVWMLLLCVGRMNANGSLGEGPSAKSGMIALVELTRQKPTRKDDRGSTGVNNRHTTGLKTLRRT